MKLVNNNNKKKDNSICYTTHMCILCSMTYWDNIALKPTTRLYILVLHNIYCLLSWDMFINKWKNRRKHIEVYKRVWKSTTSHVFMIFYFNIQETIVNEIELRKTIQHCCNISKIQYKNVERIKIDTSNTHIHDRSSPCVRSGETDTWPFISWREVRWNRSF